MGDNGKKKWTLCPNNQSRLLSTKFRTFDKAALTQPSFAKAYCGQVTVNQGEMIYYPGYWWHHTLNLETPTVAYTGALVGTEIDRDDIGKDKKRHSVFSQDMVREHCKPCLEPGNPNRKCRDN